MGLVRLYRRLTDGSFATEEVATDDRWSQKQHLAEPSRFYGNGGTVHNTGHVDVETDADGTVVAVWFRCQMLPFQQVHVSHDRAASMSACYDGPMPLLTGVEVLDAH